MPGDIGRRCVIGAGIAGLLLSGRRGNAQMELPRDEDLVKSITESRTVLRFVVGLGDGEGYSPPTWFSDVGWRPVLPEITPANLFIERKRAEFFARFAVGFVAPHYLRKAGYNDLATACEGDTNLRDSQHMAAVAQQTIGNIDRIRDERAGRPIPWPQREGLAYGASAHASTAAFYALLGDKEPFADAGYFTGQSLAEALSYDNPMEADPDETIWLWNVAHLAINQALLINSDRA